jgi:hypothetical protein
MVCDVICFFFLQETFSKDIDLNAYSVRGSYVKERCELMSVCVCVCVCVCVYVSPWTTYYNSLLRTQLQQWPHSASTLHVCSFCMHV